MFPLFQHDKAPVHKANTVKKCFFSQFGDEKLGPVTPELISWTQMQEMAGRKCNGMKFHLGGNTEEHQENTTNDLTKNKDWT